MTEHDRLLTDALVAQITEYARWLTAERVRAIRNERLWKQVRGLIESSGGQMRPQPLSPYFREKWGETEG